MPCGLGEAGKRVSLELGGNGAVIVQSDADLGYVAQRCAFGGFLRAGQACISVQRLYAHSSIVSTAGDLMRGFEMGLRRFKFFPAEASGGIPALKALSAPFGEARFCPTGGIRPETAADWLAVPSVLCVGGSWFIQDGELDFDAIGARARAAAGLVR